MEPNTQLLPEYENPPVVEVVCNLLFEPLENLLVPHVGLFWERFRTEYPECSEHDPIVPIIERFDEPPKMKIEMNEIKIASLPRVWFVQKRGNGIIQIQRDRFILNWRKVKEEDEYPRYSFVIDQFMKYLSHFKAFLDENDLGKIVPLQYEMTYVNHIPKGEGWDSLSDVGNVFPDFSWQQTRERFLPIFDGINFQTRFELPERAGRM
ncbi:MAG TPA: TIGR04255 family protein [Thermodesulfobacteriota bacterium]|nr:TIGR04255 family protein [Thermodesulfobacteriota bacterium]